MRAIPSLLLAVIALVASAIAAGSTVWRDCGAIANPDRNIIVCSRIISDTSASASDKALAYALRGLAYAEKGDTDRAIADYSEAIRLQPREDKLDAEVHMNRGVAYAAKEDYDRAIADYDEAIRVNPKYATAYYNRGLAYDNKGEYDRAIADYDEAIRLDPDYTNAYYNRGAAYAAKGDYDRAIADHDEAIRLDPKDATAYYNRGLAYDNKGEYDRAIADYDEAIRLDPKYATAYYNRGLAYNSKGEYDRAIADYNKAIQLDPAFTAAYTARGQTYQRKGHAAHAAADFNAALALPPKYANGEWAHNTAREQLAVLEEEKRQRSEWAAKLAEAAVPGTTADDLERLEKDWAACLGTETDRRIVGCTRVLTDTVERSSVHVIALVNRGQVYLNSRRGKLALQDFKQALLFDAKSLHNSDMNHLVYGCIGEYDQAIREIADELAGPHGFLWELFHAILLTERTLLHLTRGDLNSAMADIEQIQSLGSGDWFFQSIVLVLRGAVLQEMGASDRAIADFTQAIEGRVGTTFGADRDVPSSPTAIAYFLRGLSYERNGERVRAQADLEASLNVSLTDNETEYLEMFEDCEPGSALWRVGTFRTAARQRLAALTTPTHVGLGRRVALVIGNSEYHAVEALPNPVRDAAAVAEALRRRDFAEVTLLTDLSKRDMENALIDFAEEAQGADWAVVYFAGHGLEMDGENYLIPVDAELKQDRHVRLETVSLDDVLEAAGGAKALSLVILDACRSNPFLARMSRTVATRSIGRGLARVEPTGAELVVYAARDGQIALDGDGTNSPFVAALLQHLDEPGIDVRLMFAKVRDSVLAATNNAQEPFMYGSLPGITLSFRPEE